MSDSQIPSGAGRELSAAAQLVRAAVMPGMSDVAAVRLCQSAAGHLTSGVLLAASRMDGVGPDAAAAPRDEVVRLLGPDAGTALNTLDEATDAAAARAAIAVVVEAAEGFVAASTG